MMTRQEQLLRNLAAVRSRLYEARIKAGRGQESIRILPVTKYQNVEDIRIICELGIRNCAENIHQSAQAKISQLAHYPGLNFDPQDVQWHMVGQVQSKKANSIVKWASSVHSVDRSKVVHALAQGAAKATDEGIRATPLAVYIQLSLDGDPERGGASEADIFPLAEEVTQQSTLQLEGLMVVPPVNANSHQSYEKAASIRERFVAEFPQAREFSAGMSNDFDIAISYGSTCVRVGTSLFQERTLLSDK